MEYIRKSIYKQPEIRHVLVPLWSAWVLVGIGAVCGVVVLKATTMSDIASSMLTGGVIVGACSLVTVLCYWLCGDSHRPYNREIKSILEPTYAYYPLSVETALVNALESGDEKALANIKRQPKPELALVRYSDKAERIYYSQLTRVEGNKYIPLTEIIINKTK